MTNLEEYPKVMRARADVDVAYDAFNVPLYVGDRVQNANGQVGEIGGIKDNSTVYVNYIPDARLLGKKEFIRVDVPVMQPSNILTKHAHAIITLGGLQYICNGDTYYLNHLETGTKREISKAAYARAREKFFMNRSASSGMLTLEVETLLKNSLNLEVVDSDKVDQIVAKLYAEDIRTLQEVRQREREIVEMYKAASRYSWVNLEEDFDNEKVDESGTLRRENKNTQLHSLHSPAIEWANGDKVWFLNNKRHRTDGPAVELANGDKFWYVNGEFIGEASDGFTDEDFENWKQENPDKLEVTANLLNKLSWMGEGKEDFDKEYVDISNNLLRKNKNNQWHSLYSPAVERANGDKGWYQNDKCHRIDGPAKEYASGDKFWYVNGEFIGEASDGFTDEDFENWKQENPDKLEATANLLNKLSWMGEGKEDFDKEYVDISNNLLRKNKNNQWHSLYSPAAELANGDKLWYQDGKLHRTDGPAAEFANGDKSWYQNGKFHRIDGPAVERANGDKEWYVNGKLHRTDGPAMDYANGDKFWYVNDSLHRIGGPAMDYANGDKFWYQNNKLHRTDGPAKEFANGDKEWYQNGKLYRTGGPASEFANGDKFWYQNNNRHRTDGPAMDYANGNKLWYQNDKLHRTGGPAVEYANGDKFWYVNDNAIGKSDNGFTDEDFENWKRENSDELEATSSEYAVLSNLEEFKPFAVAKLENFNFTGGEDFTMQKLKVAVRKSSSLRDIKKAFVKESATEGLAAYKLLLADFHKQAVDDTIVASLVSRAAGTNPKDIPLAPGIKSKNITMDETGGMGTSKVTVEFSNPEKGLNFYQTLPGIEEQTAKAEQPEEGFSKEPVPNPQAVQMNRAQNSQAVQPVGQGIAASSLNLQPTISSYSKEGKQAATVIVTENNKFSFINEDGKNIKLNWSSPLRIGSIFERPDTGAAVRLMNYAKRDIFGMEDVDEASGEAVVPEDTSVTSSHKGKVPLQLVGLDGNAFAIMGRFRESARQHGWSQDKIQSVLAECRAGNYDHLLQTIMQYTYDPNDEDYDEDYDEIDFDDDRDGEIISSLICKVYASEKKEKKSKFPKSDAAVSVDGLPGQEAATVDISITGDEDAIMSIIETVLDEVGVDADTLIGEDSGADFVVDEKLIGGEGDGKEDQDFDDAEVIKGKAVEKEHSDDADIVDEIVKDHLSEDPKYYDKLKKVEKKSDLAGTGDRIADVAIELSKGFTLPEDKWKEFVEQKRSLYGWGALIAAAKYAVQQHLISQYYADMVSEMYKSYRDATSRFASAADDDSTYVGGGSWMEKVLSSAKNDGGYDTSVISDKLINFIRDAADVDGADVTAEEVGNWIRRYNMWKSRKASFISSSFRRVADDVSDRVAPMSWTTSETGFTPDGSGNPLPPKQELNSSPQPGVLYDSSKDSGPQFQTLVDPASKSVTVRFMDSPEVQKLNQNLNTPVQTDTPSAAGQPQQGNQAGTQTAPLKFEDQNVPINY